MDSSCSDLTKRHKHKIAGRHAGMRKLQPACVYDQIAGQKDIDVDHAGAAHNPGDSPHVGFNGLHHLQELDGIQIRLNLYGLIDKPGLASKANRFRFIQRRLPPDPDLRTLDPFSASPETSLSIAQVASQPQIVPHVFMISACTHRFKNILYAWEENSLASY